MSHKTSTKKTSAWPVSRSFVFALAGVVFIAGTSGCASLNLATSDMQTPPMTSASKSEGAYLVNTSGGFGKSSEYRGEIDGPVTVQTALERSGAIKKFRSLEITVHRVVKESGMVLKMPVNYSVRKKSVLPETNYAIHPGDRIVVTASTNNALDKLVDSIDLNRERR